jgi:hypothetical protein
VVFCFRVNVKHPSRLLVWTFILGIEIVFGIQFESPRKYDHFHMRLWRSSKCTMKLCVNSSLNGDALVWVLFVTSAQPIIDFNSPTYILRLYPMLFLLIFPTFSSFQFADTSNSHFFIHKGTNVNLLVSTTESLK